MIEKQQPSLSAAQLRAVSHIRGPALVLAGPGSGKTTVIIQRILYLIRHAGIPPEQILVITYTKAAALQMQQRFQSAWQSAGQTQSSSVHFGTFHSICYHILQQAGRVRANSLIKESDKRKLIEVLMKNHGMDELCSYDRVSLILNRISYEKNRYVREMQQTEKAASNDQHEFDMELSYEKYRILREEYDCYLREEALIDFDDMILQCFVLLRENPAVRESCQKLFPYILVDEFQDINDLQFQVLKLLAFPFNNLFVVGDDDQSIYGFRGAAPLIMKLFRQEYPEHSFLLLTENYRSGDEIVKLASEVIGRGTERFDKRFIPIRKGGKITVNCYQTRAEQESAILSGLSALSQEEQSKTAIIVRNNLGVMQYRQLLDRAGLAVSGEYAAPDNLMKGFILQDILAFLNFVYGDRKRADFLQFMNKPNHFFSRMALPGEQVTMKDMMTYYQQNREMQHIVRNYFAQLEMAKNLSPKLAVNLFRKVIGYDKHLKEKAADHREFQLWTGQLERLETLAMELAPDAKAGSRLKDLAEQQYPPRPAVFREGICVMTMHGAKGLEFDRVFLPDLNEGIIPGRQCRTPEAIEEERRLLYVAITRAKNDLYLSYTNERGRELSRYLTGLVTPSRP